MLIKQPSRIMIITTPTTLLKMSTRILKHSTAMEMKAQTLTVAKATRTHRKERVAMIHLKRVLKITSLQSNHQRNLLRLQRIRTMLLLRRRRRKQLQKKRRRVPENRLGKPY